MDRRDFLRMIGLGCLVAVLPRVEPAEPALEISQDGESWTKLPGASLKEASVLTYDDVFKFMNRPRPYDTLMGYPIVWGDWYDIEELA